MFLKICRKKLRHDSVFLCSLYPHKLYICNPQKKQIMGRGDKKTKAGKIFKGSFGKFRSSKTKKATPAKTEKKA